MKKTIIVFLTLCILAVVPAIAHDLFLKPESFFVKVGSKVSISVLNGSFLASEGAVSYSRLSDVSVVSPGGKLTKPAESDFTKDKVTAFLNLTPGEAGTYVVGLSTMTREIDLKGADFNEYLEHDGIPDILAERKANRELDKAVRERYSKHVKAIFQVGDVRTGEYKTILGYPVELVPQANPYGLKPGDTIDILCLKDGKPLANQFVMSGREEQAGKVVTGENVRSDENGIARVKLAGPGKWYVRFIEMSPLKDPKLNYESKWATLTFEIGKE